MKRIMILALSVSMLALFLCGCSQQSMDQMKNGAEELKNGAKEGVEDIVDKNDETDSPTAVFTEEKTDAPTVSDETDANPGNVDPDSENGEMLDPENGKIADEETTDPYV